MICVDVGCLLVVCWLLFVVVGDGLLCVACCLLFDDCCLLCVVCGLCLLFVSCCLLRVVVGVCCFMGSIFPRGSQCSGYVNIHTCTVSREYIGGHANTIHNMFIV